MKSTKLHSDVLASASSLLKQKERDEESYAREQEPPGPSKRRNCNSTFVDSRKWNRRQKNGAKRRSCRWKNCAGNQADGEMAALENRPSVVWEAAQDRMREIVELQDGIAELEGK